MSATVLTSQLFRPGHRAADALRPIRLTPHYVAMPEGSVLIESGNTRVLCNATIEQGVPGWLRNSGRGWVTAEYGMLPRATLTRTAAITGACVALALALGKLVTAGTLKTSPLKQMVAATSVGIVDGNILLDLCYEEDSRAAVDMNVVMLADGGLVETQATAEHDSYTRAQLGQMLDYAEKGIRELLAAQQQTLASAQ